jgi:hypothetical protein
MAAALPAVPVAAYISAQKVQQVVALVVYTSVPVV